MKTAAFLLLILFNIAGAQVGQEGAAQERKAALIGTWRFDDGRLLQFMPDRAGSIWTNGNKPIKGKWEEDPFTEQIKRFAVTWENGQVYDVEVSPDGSVMRGNKKSGDDPISGQRVKEIRVFMWANDLGTLWVNGEKMMSAGIRKTEEGRIYVRPGDVITINLANRSGVMQLGFEAFNGSDKFLSVGDFHYTEAPEIDWQKNSKFELGYRSPLMQAKRDFVIGPVKNPIIASPQKQDEKFKKIHLKHVVR